jgi:hypothetical protein
MDQTVSVEERSRYYWMSEREHEKIQIVNLTCLVYRLQGDDFMDLFGL